LNTGGEYLHGPYIFEGQERNSNKG
jgi:hypothetical protein